MAEEYYSVPADPKYHDGDIRRIQNSDPVSADNVVNPVIEALIENIAAVKKQAEGAAEAGVAMIVHATRTDNPHSVTPELIGAAAASHGTHVTYSTASPKAAGTASAGSAATVARSDHVHPAQTDVTGSAGTAEKLKTARSIQVNLGSTSAASFDGSENVTPGVTGTLPVSRGGTAKTSWTTNRLIYPSASTTLTQLAFPTIAGSVLRQGTSGAPYWTSPADLDKELGAVGTDYTTKRARGIAFSSSVPTAVSNGQIVLVYP